MNFQKVAYVMVGAPGSGKSTAAAKIAEKRNAVIISTDAIRGQLYGDESIQGSWPEISSEMDKQIKLASKAGKTVILDATHYQKNFRDQAIQRLNRFGYGILIAVVVNPALEVCLERNAGRDRKVPEDVITRMWNALQDQIDGLEDEDFAGVNIYGQDN